jgi:hypothetical protein
VLGAGSSRRRLTRVLNAAFADGLISEETFMVRLDEVLTGRLIDPRRLVGDLHFRGPESGLWERVSARMNTVITRLEWTLGGDGGRPWTLLALDWSGVEPHELIVGRHRACDVVLSDPSVSRRHARLIYRDARWVLQDLASTNGTVVNGRPVGRCELRPGDRVLVGEAGLRID